MNHLKHIIGPAPSELPIVDFLRKLKDERQRVRRNFIVFAEEVRLKETKKQTKKKKAKAKRKTAKHAPSAFEQAAKELAASGLSLEDLKKMLEKEGKNA